MKKLLFILLFIITSASFSQKIVKHKIDEFTNQVIKDTSWEKLAWNGNMNALVRGRRVDLNYYLEFKMILDNKVYSVDEGEVLLLKLSDGDILKLNNLKFEVSSVGGGSVGISGSNLLGINFTCSISESEITKLKNKDLVKLRIYTSEGYKEESVKQKRVLKFKKLISLLE
jgi:hypothetical protein|tara:strand:+ start:86 stop:598 length:513 start_codon:yes stop_codon:yes gene_type:complete